MKRWIPFGLALLLILAAMGFGIWRFSGSEWESLQRDLAARGETFDVAVLLGGPIPDERNFARSPVLLREIEGSKRPGWRSSLQLPFEGRPRFGGGAGNRTFDAGAWLDYLKREKLVTQPREDLTPAAAILEAMARELPELAELESELRTRPETRWPETTAEQMIARFSAGVLNRIADALVLRGQAAIAVGDRDLALRSIESLFRLGRAAGAQGMLIGGLVRITLEKRTQLIIAELLAAGGLSEPQLQTLAELVRSGAMRTEDMESWLRLERAVIVTFVRGTKLRFGSTGLDPMQPAVLWLFKDRIAHDVSWTCQEFLDEVLVGERVDAARADRIAAEYDARIARPVLGIPARITGIFLPMYDSVFVSFTQTRATSALALMAIAIERHRLRAGSLPASLAELGADLASADVLDPVGGGAPHYRIEGEGYRLWFDGWNRRDDGGTEPPRGKRKEGDWIWEQRRE